MNLALFYSFAIHFLLFCLLLLGLAAKPINQKNKAMYTIDFIGQSDEVMRYGAPQQAQGGGQQAQAPKAEEAPKPQEAKQEIKSEIKAETKTKAKSKNTEYNSKAQISTKTTKKKEKKKKFELLKPSVLEKVETDNLDVSALHSLTTGGQGGNGQGDGQNTVQASFTNFPYPWYITQVRNALWTAWQKHRPKNGYGLSALVSFTIDKNGAIYDTQLEKTSGNEAYDYAALNAARESAPYPPLPKDFNKDILTVTVEFKQEI